MVATPPRTVRIAGGAVTAEGVVGLALGVVAMVASGSVAGWGFLVVVAAALGAAGVALLRGVRGARGPALVGQLLLLGVAYYAAVPSHQPTWGVPVALVAAGTAAALVSRPTAAWIDDLPG